MATEEKQSVADAITETVKARKAGEAKRKYTKRSTKNKNQSKAMKASWARRKAAQEAGKAKPKKQAAARKKALAERTLVLQGSKDQIDRLEDLAGQLKVKSISV